MLESPIELDGQLNSLSSFAQVLEMFGKEGLTAYVQAVANELDPEAEGAETTAFWYGAIADVLEGENTQEAVESLEGLSLEQVFGTEAEEVATGLNGVWLAYYVGVTIDENKQSGNGAVPELDGVEVVPRSGLANGSNGHHGGEDGAGRQYVNGERPDGQEDEEIDREVRMEVRAEIVAGEIDAGEVVIDDFDEEDDDEEFELDGEEDEYVAEGEADDLSELRDDQVGRYLREIARVPLLTSEEEVELAMRIEKGKAASKKLVKLEAQRDGGDEESVDEGLPEQIRMTSWQIEDGLAAREHMIRANLRLVVSIAKRYMGRGVPFLDLIQEGNLGLMKAVQKYDYKRGFRVSTYATWWIRQTITRAIADQGRTIRVPVHMSERLRRLLRMGMELEQEQGRRPTPEELALPWLRQEKASKGEPMPQGRQLEMELKQATKKVKFMMKISQHALSLEMRVGEDDDSELGDFIEDDSYPDVTEATDSNILGEKIEEALGQLTPREARILRLRFGLGKNSPHTLEEVGQKFGLTRERIRQIEGRALRRLRHPRRARQLRDYL